VHLAVAPDAIRVGQVIRAVEPRFQACGPLEIMLSEEPISPVDRALDRTIGRGIAAFMEALDQTSIAMLVGQRSASLVA
jgi:DNA-binding IscR family transcriptional regulator